MQCFLRQFPSLLRSLVGFLVVAMVAMMVVLSTERVFAQANPEINYQGKLTDATGQAVPDGDYNMRFYLYNATGGATTTAIWTETLTGANAVAVQNGLFSIMLGSTTPLTIDFDQTLYLGVEIGATGTPAWDGEMLPRKVLGTVPAAFQAINATNAADAALLGGIASSSFLRSDIADQMDAFLALTAGASTTNLTVTGTATTTNLVVGTDFISDLTGAGLSIVGNALSISTTTLGLGDGTLNGLDDVNAASILGSLLYYNGTIWDDLATSSLNIALVNTTGTLPVNRGGTGATTESGARTNLGLSIGTDVQAFDTELAALAGLTSAANALPYFTGAGTAGVTTLSSFARTLLDDADNTAARSTLGLGSLAILSTVGSTQITDNEVNFADINYGNTLASNPALLVDECYFTTTVTGGGFICEGSTADNNEQLYLFPDVNGADTTQTIALTDSAMTGTFDGNNFAGGAVAAGDLLYGSATGTISELGIGTNGRVLQVVAGVPAWVSTSTLGISGTTLFTGLTDTPSDFSINGAIPYESADALAFSSNFTYNGTNLTVGGGILGSYFGSTAADIADAGAIRLGNGELVAWESSPTGTDVSLSVDASERLVFTGGGAFIPGVNGGASLGVSGTAFSDLFLASGGVLNFDAGDITLTDTGTNILTLAGGNFALGANYLNNDGGTEGLSFGTLGETTVTTGATTNNALTVTANSLTTGSVASIYSNSANTSARSILSIVNDNAAASGAVALRIQQDSTADIVNIFDGATEVFTILDGGNVGIGTTTPPARLTIEHTDTTNALAVYDKANDSSPFVVTAAGDVGIGIAAPNAKLEVIGEVKATGLLWAAGGSSGVRRVARYENFNDTASLSGVDFGVKLGNSEFQGLSWFKESAWTNVSSTSAKDVGFNLGVLRDNVEFVALTVTAAGDLGIGTTSPVARLGIERTGVTGAGVIGLDQYLQTTNSTLSAVQFGNRMFLDAAQTATTTLVGSIIRVRDNSILGNTIRGFEVQADRGTNTQGENTALSGFARTFGVRGTTRGDAGGTFEPAGGFFETQGTTQGNAIRGFSQTITTAALLSLYHASSTFTGTGLEMNFGNTTGEFASTSSRFVDFQNAGTSVFTVSAFGTTTIGDGVTQAGLQIPNGGICVDDDGACTASTSGRITAREFQGGNSDLAEMYFSSQTLAWGEIVSLERGLSVSRATTETKRTVLGVVSTAPGLVMGADDVSLRDNETAYPIALAGRVPIKLSNENGPIKAGDDLTLSSLPGVAMRATSSGLVIGIALEDFDETRAYSDTYINQYADNIIVPEYMPVTSLRDPRIADGCFMGGGGAIEGEVCVPLVATTSAAQVREAEALAASEARDRELRRLARQSSERVTLESGRVVAVGQIVMFVDLRYRYLGEVESTMLATLMMSSASTTNMIFIEDTVWSRLVQLASSFIDGVLSLTGLKAERIETSTLCVDDVCVTADDLRTLLETANNDEQVIDVVVPESVGSASEGTTSTADESSSADTRSELPEGETGAGETGSNVPADSGVTGGEVATPEDTDTPLDPTEAGESEALADASGAGSSIETITPVDTPPVTGEGDSTSEAPVELVDSFPSEATPASDSVPDPVVAESPPDTTTEPTPPVAPAPSPTSDQLTN